MTNARFIVEISLFGLWVQTQPSWEHDGDWTDGATYLAFSLEPSEGFGL